MSAPEAGAPALATNQRRARGLRQIVSRHLLATDDVTPRDGVTPLYYYFTLATSRQAAPVYTSEAQLSATAIWEPLHLELLLGRAANAEQVLVRVLARCGDRQAEILCWAVTLAGLVPVSLRWTFQPNTLLFRFGTVWLTAPECVADRQRPPPPPPLAVPVPTEAVGVAARGPQLERLHRCQRERHRLETAIEAAAEAGAALWPVAERHRRTLAARDQLQRRLALLRADTAARAAAVAEARRALAAARARQASSAAQLARQSDELRRDCTALSDWRGKFAALHALHAQASAQLAFRRRELCAELQIIYPLRSTAEGFTIQGVHLPNAEEYSTAPDRAVSVALAHVSHLVTMVAWVLGVCLRYPIRQRDAHPVLVDHIVPGLPEGERLFPLQLAGRDNLAFNYAVYLLNKNIAQLRQYCALETSDLRAMLPNLASLLKDAVPPAGDGASAPWPGGALYWPCGPPPAPRGREQSLRLPPASVTLQDAVEDGWGPGGPGDVGAGPRGGGSPADSGAAGSEDGSATPAEQPASLDTAESAAEPPAQLGAENGVAEPPALGPSPSPPPPPSSPSLTPTPAPAPPPAPAPAPPPAPAQPQSPVYCEPNDDTDWDYVTSRMQILAKPKSFKLVSKRGTDEA